MNTAQLRFGNPTAGGTNVCAYMSPSIEPSRPTTEASLALVNTYLVMLGQLDFKSTEPYYG